MLDIKTIKKQIYKYIIISIFFLIFGIIYEFFSHGVYSTYMIGAFLIPLIMGCFIYTIIYYLKMYSYLSSLGTVFFNTSILSFTIGCIMKGVLEIYGTTNQLIVSYLFLGIVLTIVSFIIHIYYNVKGRRNDLCKN